MRLSGSEPMARPSTRGLETEGRIAFGGRDGSLDLTRSVLHRRTPLQRLWPFLGHVIGERRVKLYPNPTSGSNVKDNPSPQEHPVALGNLVALPPGEMPTQLRRRRGHEHYRERKDPRE